LALIAANVDNHLSCFANLAHVPDFGFDLREYFL
jgi:hypothetical protein